MMGYLLVGLALLFFDYDLSFGTALIGVIPDWLGYLLIYFGLRKIRECRLYTAARRVAVCAAVYSLAAWLADLVGLTAWETPLPTILLVLSAAVQLLVTFLITRGIQELESSQEIKVGGKRLMIAWLVTAAATVLFYLLIPLSALGLVGAAVSLVAEIVFLVFFYQVKEDYGIYSP